MPKVKSIVDGIVEGKSIRGSIQESVALSETFRADYKKIAKSFTGKMDDFYEELSGVHDAALNLKKYGRDYEQDGELGRKYLENVKAQAIKLKAAFDNIKNALYSLLSDYGYDEYDSEYINVASDEETLNYFAGLNIDTVDLDELSERV